MIEFGEKYVGRKVKTTRETDSIPNEELGVIIDYDDDDYFTEMHYRVKFDCRTSPCWVLDDSIKFVEDDNTEVDKDTNMPYAEIWDMLEPKMKKNGLVSHSGYVKIEPSDLPGCHYHHPVKTYDEDDVQKAVALAYKIGYMRAMKGRPFKYADSKANVTIDNLDEVEGNECPCAPCWAKPVAKKKVKPMGHWEKVDPENLPKEGSRVRYSRPNKCYHVDPIYIGDTGMFELGGPYNTTGIKCDKDNRWRSFSGNNVSCLDVWIEGEGDAE